MQDTHLRLNIKVIPRGMPSVLAELLVTVDLGASHERGKSILPHNMRQCRTALQRPVEAAQRTALGESHCYNCNSMTCL